MKSAMKLDTFPGIASYNLCKGKGAWHLPHVICAYIIQSWAETLTLFKTFGRKSYPVLRVSKVGALRIKGIHAFVGEQQ